jgi:prefoldin beta subunit
MDAEQQHLQEAFEQLQYHEHTLQQILAQKQQLQIEYAEVENATKEVNQTKGLIYKMIGGIMVQVEREPICKELQEKTEELTKHIQAMQKQEKSIMEQAHAIKQTLQRAVEKRTQKK